MPFKIDFSKSWCLKILLFSGLFLLVSIIIFIWNPVREHWIGIFRPAAIELLSFRNPYTVGNFFNPPWALIPIIPFAVLPEQVGNALYATFSLFMFGYVARKMGANWWITLIFLFLPQTLYNTIQVNLDWMVALGFILPPRWGLLFILIKPQLGIFLALFWFIEAYRKGKIIEVAHTFGFVSLAYLISFLIFGVFLSKSQFLFGIDQFSFWPESIPIGLALFSMSIKSRKPGYAIACTPFLTPYIQPYSWSVAALGILSDVWISFPVLIGMWSMVFETRYWYMLSRLLHIK